MKNALKNRWFSILLTFMIGMAASAAIFAMVVPQRGASIVLTPGPTPGPMQVQVDGAVLHPGVYTLARTSRAQSAIQAAGGFRADANTRVVNLAAPLTDGQKLVIPSLTNPGSQTDAPGAQTSATASSAQPLPIDPLDLNLATLEELQTLPGIGLARAQEIIAYRLAHNGFQSIDEIQNISGIGPATFEKLKPFLRAP